MELFRNVSLVKCKLICNQVLDYKCSGIFWNRLEGSCWLTSYTGDNQNDMDCDTRRKDIVFFRRQRTPCKGLENASQMHSQSHNNTDNVNNNNNNSNNKNSNNINNNNNNKKTTTTKTIIIIAIIII